MVSITDMVPIWFEVDSDGRITGVDPRVEKVLGYKPSELIGSPFLGLVHFEDLPAPRNALSRASPGDIVCDIRLIAKSGAFCSMHCQFSPRPVEGQIMRLTVEITEPTSA